MPKRNAPAALTHETAVADRITRERDLRGWSLEVTAKRMTDAGCPINPSAIYKIESGEPRRRVTVNELVAFAIVFELPIAELVLPAGVADQEVRMLRDELHAAKMEYYRLQDRMLAAKARLGRAEEALRLATGAAAERHVLSLSRPTASVGAQQGGGG
jgi:transcriptional regulator with XRE-family HTH domain